MRTRKHPLSGAIYDVRPDGLVDVTQGDRHGVFTSEGHRVEGDLYSVDIHLCGWLAGPQLPTGTPGNPKDFPAEQKEKSA
ncbi:MAG: hypothetical protein ACR2JS_07725 [Candidatus Nanopelagicales bacterium]